MGARLLTQYIVVRRDLLSSLNWPLGSLFTQACHASTAAIFHYVDNEDTYEYLTDLENMHKVVLQCENQESLLKLESELTTNKIDFYLWTERPENIPTALATRPYKKDQIREHFRKFNLFS